MVLVLGFGFLGGGRRRPKYNEYPDTDTDGTFYGGEERKEGSGRDDVFIEN